MNRFETFMKVVEKGSFTKAADEMGYTQSAISQMIQTLENELEATLFIRSRKGIRLTPDGKQFLPYISNVRNAYRELMEKKKEMQGLESGLIRIGTFSSVSSNWLPPLIKAFKKQYPSVQFQLQQGEYTSIVNSIKDGSVDFGFVNPKAVKELHTIPLQEDEMLAILPVGHRLAGKERVTLEELSHEPYILLDEGEISEPLEFFKQKQLEPNIQFRVHDDYTIMSMVENGLGISILPEMILRRINYKLVKKRISPPIKRMIAISYKNKKILPISSRYFIDFIIDQFKRETFLDH